jgi:hypothetical protein
MNIGGLPANPRAQYRIHKMMLQQFQYARPKKYWVCKGFHGGRLPEFFECYPDAKIIWIHRDPVQAIASRIMLTGELVEGLTDDRIDWNEQARVHTALARAGFKATLENPMIGDSRIHHVRYPDFTSDPIGTIKGFYTKYGVPFGSDTETAMRDYLTNNKGDRYGKFKYSTDIIGENIDALHREFEPYRKRFGLEIERRSA